ncbi:MAG TPA: CpXC domain-containing protein [Elusimicrobiales bacterium]|nr:CpXC domain-containing protein [Elusimicrobiales bacterium]
MSSIASDIDVTCPNKCNPFPVKVWTLIRADLDTDVKHTIINGELNLIKCPGCGVLFYYQTPVVYIDAKEDVFIFMFPHEYESQKNQWRKKMNDDFKVLKKGFLRELKINCEPTIVFGMENLKKILQEHENTHEESQVITFLAEKLKFELRKIKPSDACKKGFPFVVPYEGESLNKKSLVSACEKVLKGHYGLKRLKNFLQHILKTKKLPI